MSKRQRDLHQQRRLKRSEARRKRKAMQIRIDGLKELIGKMPILKRAADLAMIRDWQMLNRRARQDAPAKTDGVIAMAIALHARGGNNAS